jgi:hypothetical protein
MELYWELRKFISNIEHLIPSINDLNEEMLDILSLFIFHHHLSIYQIHKIMEEYSRKMTYKNTHKKVVKLIDLKLIEKVIDAPKIKKTELDRGAKYYGLSEEGIFALFYNSSVILKPSIYYVQRAFENGKTVEDLQEIFSEYKKEIFKNHQNCTFFKLFLLPWITMETIENASDKLFDTIRLFLNYCCNLVKDHIIRFSKNIHELEPSNASIYVDQLKSPDPFPGKKSVDVDDVSLFSYMKSFFSQILNLIKINRSNNKGIILLIKSLDSNQKMLLYKDKENIPNILSFYKNTDNTSLFTYSINHKSLKLPSRLKIEHDIDLKSLYNIAVFLVVYGKSNEDDLKLLKEDVKFMNTLSELKERFNEGYELIAK